MSSNFPIALLLTIVIEVFIAVLFGFRNKNSILGVVFINLITNPIFNYFLWINTYFSFVSINQTLLLIFETVIILVEWLLLIFTLRQNTKRLLVLSITMNFCSYIVGVLIFR